MKILTKKVTSYLDNHKNLKQWLWFILLWLGGIISAFVLTYPIKLLIKFM
ncbi:MAG: hypothetical protein SFV53_05480 [Rickettsiales bacterium]|nr:hypothetical protein [Rickettsiales bacterium]